MILRNSEYVLDAMQASVRYGYAHSPGVKVTVEPYTDTDLRIIIEQVEPGIPYSLQAYEMSMGLIVRMHRLLAGAQAPITVSFMHPQLGSDAAHRDALGCPVRFGQTWCGAEAPSYVLQLQRRRHRRPTRHASTDTARRLASEGMSCQDVIDRERRTLAARYLAEPGLHLGQIAWLLGYTEQSALNRSCRRWFGKTPRECRAELITGLGSRP